MGIVRSQQNIEVHFISVFLNNVYIFLALQETSVKCVHAGLLDGRVFLLFFLNKNFALPCFSWSSAK